MKYLVVGAGGTGGCIGAFMAEAGKDVTLIARGEHLKRMREHGLVMETTLKGNFVVDPIKATDMEHYRDIPDVVFVCVKGYSLPETVPFLRRICDAHTIVIPILNIYGTGGRLQKELPGTLVTDGCIYTVSQIKEPGVISQNWDKIRVVYGVRNPEEFRSELSQISADLKDSGIEGILSDNIRRDTLRKFSYVSPMGACGLYYNAAAGEMQKPGECRDTFVRLIKEIEALAVAMGIPFRDDMAEVNLEILDSLSPKSSTSMQRDVYAGKSSEIDGLIYEVVRMGREYHVPVPTYEMIAEKMREQGLA